jgi:small subunit ribosomal protein S4
MGDPKQTRKKFSAPPHPWQKARIDEEKELLKEYGLKNKSEVWKIGTKAKNFAAQAKRLTAQDTAQSKKEEKQLLERIYRIGLLAKGADIADVLGLTIKDFMERRLQTIVFKKGLARGIKQARQFVTHQHIAVNGKIITSPSYIVLAAEEGSVSFVQKSALANEMHPERVVEKSAPKPKKPKKAGAKEEKKEGKAAEKKKGPKKEKKKEEKPAAGAKKEEKPAEAPKQEKKEEKAGEKKE